ncbi:hypothetical protein [Serratia fonticola]|uniref:hypothetical protein n=1 Tax=Serratia fonticola TaxID=47917 RepID=UPI003AACE3E0
MSAVIIKLTHQRWEARSSDSGREYVGFSDPVFVAVAHIESFASTKSRATDMRKISNRTWPKQDIGITELVMISGDIISVGETPEEIMALIDQQVEVVRDGN